MHSRLQCKFFGWKEFKHSGIFSGILCFISMVVQCQLSSLTRWNDWSSWFVSVLMTSHVLLSCPQVRQLAPLAARAPNLSCSSVIFYWSSPDSGLFHRGVSFDSASSPFKFSWRQRNCWREFCQPEMTVELLSESELSECLGCDRAGCELWSAPRSVQFLWIVFSPSYRGEGCAKVKLFVWIPLPRLLWVSRTIPLEISDSNRTTPN